ncbi:sulfotransferase, partial [Candidatus Omnitrophota bacterium]
MNKDKICIIAGMPRTGTTFLYYNMQRHPSIFVTIMKETDFFSLNYDRGFNWYGSLYEKMMPGQVGFDISPLYFQYNKLSIERIREFNPSAKVILTVREPVSWICSLYNSQMSLMFKKIDFSEFIKGYDYVK